jgi:hypothetical protein
MKRDYEKELEDLNPKDRNVIYQQGLEVKLNEEKTARNSDKQAQQLRIERLFERIDNPLEIPDLKMKNDSELPPAWEYVRPRVIFGNRTEGISEYHQYKVQRQKELERLKKIEIQEILQGEQQQFDQQIQNYREKEDEKTAKKRLKRQKRKEQKRKKTSTQSEVGNPNEATNQSQVGNPNEATSPTDLNEIKESN